MNLRKSIQVFFSFVAFCLSSSFGHADIVNVTFGPDGVSSNSPLDFMITIPENVDLTQPITITGHMFGDLDGSHANENFVFQVRSQTSPSFQDDNDDFTHPDTTDPLIENAFTAYLVDMSFFGISEDHDFFTLRAFPRSGVNFAYSWTEEANNQNTNPFLTGLTPGPYMFAVGGTLLLILIQRQPLRNPAASPWSPRL